MRPGLVLVLLAIGAALLGSCLVADARCPCGQIFQRDPFNPDSLNIGADHDESVHCFCRCGDDPPQRLDPSSTCEAYEGLCRTSDGASAERVCE